MTQRYSILLTLVSTLGVFLVIGSAWGVMEWVQQQIYQPICRQAATKQGLDLRQYRFDGILLAKGKPLDTCKFQLYQAGELVAIKDVTLSEAEQPKEQIGCFVLPVVILIMIPIALLYERLRKRAGSSR